MFHRIGLFLILGSFSFLLVANRLSVSEPQTPKPEVRATQTIREAQEAQGGQLYAGFLDPPREYST
jgi:hypothetical protein